ncbi:transmembrane protein 269 isoform X2 [Chiloscyllium plagiosum]|uniref:transmembrane protein 269 isoform X2 n=1 Tax=Chiloscyllium plagiosum TaxID=36176 RepID=UPI001CB86F9A|nr:transmembrane protein 269 isoform X2 [Chiloscyllium plagiosum]
MFILRPPSSIFQYAKKLFLSEQAGRIHLQELARKNIANALSLTNLMMGLSSILCSLNEHHHCACWLLFFGFLLDLADGAVARQLNACSVLGAKLDDFADFTTFGIATSLLLQAHGILDGVIVICYVMAVFTRLCFFSSVVMILFMTDHGNYPHDKVLESQVWKKIVYIGGLMMLFCCPLRLACIYFLIWCFSYTLFPSTLWSCRC